jgi:hypothetical protein
MRKINKLLSKSESIKKVKNADGAPLEFEKSFLRIKTESIKGPREKVADSQRLSSLKAFMACNF